MQSRLRVSRMIPLAALVAIGFGVAPARAGYIELSGSVQATTLSIASVYNDPTTGAAFIDLGPTTSVTLMTPNSDPGQANGIDHIDVTGDGSDVTFGLIDVATDKSTTYQALSINFAFSVTLTDYAAPGAATPYGTGTFQVTGRLSGSIGGGKKVNLNQIQSYAMSPSDGKLTIGADQLTVSNLLYNPAGANFPGVFTAHIKSFGMPAPVPEPGSIALLGLGGLGVAQLIRRRRATVS